MILADFVLVWEEDLRSRENPSQDKTDTHEIWRETFLENLRVAGLKIDQVRGGKERVDTSSVLFSHDLEFILQALGLTSQGCESH